MTTPNPALSLDQINPRRPNKTPLTAKKRLKMRTAHNHIFIHPGFQPLNIHHQLAVCPQLDQTCDRLARVVVRSFLPFAHPTSFNRTRSAIVVQCPGLKWKLPRATDQPKSGLQCVLGGTFSSASWLAGVLGIYAYISPAPLGLSRVSR